MDIKKLNIYKSEFLKKAETLPLEDKYTFYVVYENFLTHVRLLKQLDKSLKEEGSIISKEYVKNRPCLVVHPAISQFNNTSKSLGTTIATLYKILEKAEPQKTNTAKIIEKLKGNN